MDKITTGIIARKVRDTPSDSVKNRLIIPVKTALR